MADIAKFDAAIIDHRNQANSEEEKHSDRSGMTRRPSLRRNAMMPWWTKSSHSRQAALFNFSENLSPNTRVPCMPV
jgi:hypothetical protein